MRLLLLVPALLYLVLLVLNLDIFQASTQINFFGIARFELPVVISISLFFILYILLIWIGFSFGNIFSNHKNKRLEKEVFELKSKLLNQQETLLSKVDEKYSSILDQLKTQGQNEIDQYKKAQEKLLSNMQYDFKDIQEKVLKLMKQK